jgi:glutaredoxin
MEANARILGARSRGRLLWIALIAVLLPGCDNLDPSVLLPQRGDSAAMALAADGASSDAVAEGAAQDGDQGLAPPPRDPEMQSIGPDESQRVYYQFVDDRGRVQFVERLADVPAAWRDRVGYLEMSQPPPLSPLEARRTWQLSADRTAEILMASRNSASASRGRGGAEIVLYSATWCGYCTKARAHLDRDGIEYEIRDVDIEAVAQELREKTGRGGVPVLDFSGEILRGYSPGQYDRVIRAIQG